MKVSIAVCRLYLKESKVLSDGTHPIMLMVSFNGRKEKSTGYSCTSRYWDAKRECVKKGFPNFLMINTEINKLKQLAIDARNRFIASEVDYTPTMIIESLYEKKDDCRSLKDVIAKYIDEKCIKKNTVYNWNYLFNLMSEYKYKEILVTELDEKCVKGFIKWCSDKSISDGVIRTLCARIGAICKYGIGLGLMSEDRYPFKTFKYTSKLKQANNILYIHRKTIEFMKEWLMDRIIVRNGNLWHYVDGIEDEVVKISGRYYPLYMYLMIYLFQGLAPIDISLIKREDIDVRRIKGNDYWCVDLKRSKTNKSVPIRIPRHNVYNEAMMGLILMFGDGEYLMPILKGYSDRDEETKKHRVKWVFKTCMKRLYDDWRVINDDIIKTNVEAGNGSEIPLIDEGCTYYSARHSYAQNYMECGGNALSLATLLGRSVDSIGTYVKSLTRDDDLVDVII